MKPFRTTALAALIASLVQIASGGLVRATGSGDACPDWPKCFGRWVPPLRTDTLIEYTHRLMASVVILLVLAVVVVGLVKHVGRRHWGPAALALGTVVIQALIGAVVVASKNAGSPLPEAELVTFHIAVATAFIGLMSFTTMRAFLAERPEPSHPQVDATTVRLGIASAVAVFGLILLGAYVRGEGAGLAFLDWPLMNGRVIPEMFGLGILNFAHRAAAFAVGLLLATYVVRALRTKDARLRLLAVAAGSAFVIQAVVGGLQVLTRLAVAPVIAHVALSSIVWAALIASVTVARHLATERSIEEASATAPEGGSGSAAGTSPQRAGAGRAGWKASVKAYFMLTKPRIIILLLVTTVPSMLLAARGMPSIWLILATLAGGTLAAGSANTINCYIDRDIDQVMKRTRGRPLPAHQVAPTRALLFGLVLAVASFALLWTTVNLLSAFLGLAAILFYIFVYTLGLKRSTPQNIVIGGAAGAVPVLVGWSSVTGTVGIEAAILFAVIFFWTPPHFWALAMRYAADYAAAGVPMMPVVAGAKSTQRQILAYAIVTVIVTFALVPAAGMGLVYLVAAGVLGAFFIRSAAVLWRRGTPAAAMGLFKYSISYLALLFVAVGVDAVVHVTA